MISSAAYYYWQLSDLFCCVHHSRLPVLISRPDNPKNCPFSWGDLDPHLIMVSWAHGSQPPKTHLNWFNIFAEFSSRTWSTDRYTDKPCYSVCSNGLHLAIAAMWPKSLNFNKWVSSDWVCHIELFWRQVFTSNQFCTGTDTSVTALTGFGVGWLCLHHQPDSASRVCLAADGPILKPNLRR